MTLSKFWRKRVENRPTVFEVEHVVVTFDPGVEIEPGDINAALKKHYAPLPIGVVPPTLKVESLEATLRVLTFNSAHIKFSHTATVVDVLPVEKDDEDDEDA